MGNFLHSLRFRLWLLVLVAVLPAIGVIIYTGARERSDGTVKAEAQALGTAQLTADEFQMLTSEAQRFLSTLALLPDVIALNSQNCNSLFANDLSQNPQYANIGAITPDGNVFASAVPAGQQFNFADKAWFQEAISSGDFTVGDYMVGPIIQQYTLHLALPFSDVNGATKGVVFVAMNLQFLEQRMSSAKLPSGSAIVLVDSNGVVLARYPDPAGFVGRPMEQTPIVQMMLAQGSGTARAAGVDGQVRLYGFVPMTGTANGPFLAVGIPPSVAFADVNAAVRRNLIALLATVLVAFVATWIITGRLVLRPVGKLVAASRRLAVGDLEARSGVADDQSELGEMARAFDDMGSSLLQRQQERDKAEGELHQALQHINAHIENSPLAVIEFDPEFRITRWSPEAKRLFGWAPEEVMGKAIKELHWVVEEDTGKVDQVSSEMSAGEKPRNKNINRNYRKDGSVVLCEWYNSALHDDKGNMVSILSQVLDVTEREKAERELKTSEALSRSRAQSLQAVLDSAPTSIWIAHDRQSRIITGNKFAQKLLRTEAPIRTSDQVSDTGRRTGYRWLKDGKELAAADLPLRRTAESGRALHDYSMDVVFDDGTSRSLLGDVVPLLDDQGNPAGAVAAFMDITERQRMEDDLRETRDYLNNLLDYANAPIIVWDPGFRITRFNHAFERLTGLNAKQALGRHLDFLFPSDRRVKAMDLVKKTLSGERFEVVEIPILRQDGMVRTVLWNSATLYAADGRTVVAAIAQGQDITERKAGEEDIRRLNDELARNVRYLENANKELEAFSYSVSHDLRAPLRAIDGFSQVLLEEYSNKVDDEGQRFLRIIRANSQKMGQLINDLLAFSRLSRQALNLAFVDMDTLAGEAVEEQKTAVPDRTVNWKVDRLPPAYGDRSMIRQVLVNLVANAVKFTRPREDAEIEIGARSEKAENVYYVKDNGVGFDMQYYGKLFGVFQRLHRDEEFEGTGVGLAIAQRVVHRHGGRIWAESKPGAGATFFFALPGNSGSKDTE
jgi:PAS domain S-box-containing protein